MKRIITVLTVAALMAAMVVAGAGNAFAFTYFDNNGNAENAPGYQKSEENCASAGGKQTAKGVAAGGGSKEGIPAPLNCDRFFQ